MSDHYQPRLVQSPTTESSEEKFEYKIDQNAPGADRFNRIDTRLAKESRKEMWDFWRVI